MLQKVPRAGPIATARSGASAVVLF